MIKYSPYFVNHEVKRFPILYHIGMARASAFHRLALFLLRRGSLGRSDKLYALGARLFQRSSNLEHKARRNQLREE